jgi:protease PrsW
MDPWAVVSGIFAPAIFWIAYLYYYNDREHPEPILPVGLSYLAGLAAAVLCLHVYGLAQKTGFARDPWWAGTPRRVDVLAYTFLLAGPLEELAKFVPFALFCLHLRALDEVVDGVVYASAVALGFASYENLFYLPSLEGREFYARAFSSPLVHTLFASIWGYACARAKIEGRGLVRPATIGLLVAAALHGLYDFLALDPALRVGSSVAALAIWGWRMWTVERLRRPASAP